MRQINLESFLRQQVHWNGIAVKCVYDEHIKITGVMLFQCPLQRQTCISRHSLNLCRRITNKREVRIRRSRIIDDLRIDFIKSHQFSRTAIRCDGSNAHAYQAVTHLAWPKAKRARSHKQAESAVKSKIHRRPSRISKHLVSVSGPTVYEQPDGIVAWRVI